MKTSKLELENMIQGFILSYQTEGKSPNTITWYRDFINRFMQFLKSRDYPTIIASINQNHIRTSIWYLQTEARTPYKERLLSQATRSICDIFYGVLPAFRDVVVSQLM